MSTHFTSKKASFLQGPITPIPGFVLPLIFGLGTGLGIASSVASVSIQGVQHQQATKQIEEQEELTKLQKKLGEYQLKQFEELEKEKKMKPFATPMNLGAKSNMMTRSMTMAQRGTSTANLTNMGSLQRGMPVVNRVINPMFSGSYDDIDLAHRVPLQRFGAMGSMSSLGSVQNLNQETAFATPLARAPSQQALSGSRSSLLRRENPFQRSNLRHHATLPDLAGDYVEMQPMSSAAVLQPSLHRNVAAPGLYTIPENAVGQNVVNRNMFTRMSNFARRLRPFGRTNDPVSLPYQNMFRPVSNLVKRPARGGLIGKFQRQRMARATGYTDLDHPMNRGMSLAAGYDDIDIEDRPPIRNFSLAQSSRNALRRIRTLFPTRHYDEEERQPLLGAPRRSFFNRHKRKLIIGGAIAGTAAVVGGTIAGILTAAKRKKTMQSDVIEPKGMFEQLSSGSMSMGGGGGSSGGGGGSGFGRYQTIQAAAKKYRARGGSRKRKQTAKKTKKRNTVKRGKVHKKKKSHRRSKKAVHSINKRRKKGKKKQTTTLFKHAKPPTRSIYETDLPRRSVWVGVRNITSPKH